MSKFIEHYNKFNLEIRRKNIDKLLTDVEFKDPSLIKKIKAHIERWGLKSTVGNVLDDIKDNEYAQMMFVKKPQLQNLSEKVQKKYIEKATNFKLKILPKGGPDAIHLGGNSKSIDFLNETNGDLIFAKVTMHTGGSQDGVKVEAKALADVAVNHLDKKIVFLLDGDYFKDSVLNEIKGYIKTDNIIITNSDNYGKEGTNSTK